LLKNKSFKTDGAVRQKKLDALRLAIRKASIDEELVDAVIAKATSMGFWGPEKGLFIRSSTNAEDLPGFNGAGLYDTVPNVKGREALAEAIKQVWSSVWNLRAYEEREYFGIDHSGTYGAVLVQAGVNPTAAGVLITAHIFDPNAASTYTINAKSGLGIRVVDGHKMPEQILFDYASNTIRVLSRSDEDTMLVFDDSGGVKEVPVPGGKGEPVLSDARAAALVDVARKVARVFPLDPQDIEWLFEGDIIYVVQSRPYVTR
ncbi:MAG: PEP/pyruvate-binding domain-containing protein, partial [Myxococcota bacterium]|nr:PEP/pyruvate-binding domain-containing protein [Myxococcota bacterium]